MRNNYIKELLENESFTPLEKEIIKLKKEHFEEWTNARIAMELNISERKLYRYLKKINTKIKNHIGA